MLNPALKVELLKEMLPDGYLILSEEEATTMKRGEEILTPAQAAKFLGISLHSLNKHRSTGQGPVFHHPRGYRSPYYLRTELEKWMLAQPAYRNTIEATRRYAS